MNDLINRKSVIAFINELEKKSCKYDDIISKTVLATTRAIKGFCETLPSSQPEQRWIPCSERLPEKSGWYIVTTKLVENDFWVSVSQFSIGCGWDAIRYGGNERPVAWMPLPEPYKGDEQDE